jgi:hypothetical protein
MLCRQPPSTPPAAGKTWSIEDQITGPIASRAAKTSAPPVTRPSSCSGPANQIQQRRQVPHRSTPASVRTPPAVSSLEAFRTPAAVHPLTPVTGRRPKSLNSSSSQSAIISGFQLSAILRNHPPAKSLPHQIPMDRPALTTFPRVRSSEAFGRRPLTPGRSLTPGRHPKP